MNLMARRHFCSAPGGSPLHYLVRGSGNRQVMKRSGTGLDIMPRRGRLTALDYAMVGAMCHSADARAPRQTTADFLRSKAQRGARKDAGLAPPRVLPSHGRIRLGHLAR